MRLQKVIGENIQRVRKAKKLSQDDLCGKLKTMQQARLSNIETGKIIITIKTLEQIAKALSVSPSELVRDTNKEHLDLTETIKAINLLPAPKRKPLLEIIEAYIQRELGK